MSDVPDRLRARLRLADDEDVEVWVEWRSPSSASYGLSAGEATGLRDELRRGLAEDPEFAPATPLIAAFPDAECWARDEAVLRFSATPLESSGAVEQRRFEELGETLTVLDARGPESWVLFSLEGVGRVLVHAERGVLRILRASGRFHFARQSAVPLPRVAWRELAGPHEVMGWLESRLDVLASSNVWYERVAAVGTLARLGFEAAIDRDTWASALLSDEDTPEDRCRRWAEDSSELLDEIVRVVLDEAGELELRIARLPNHVDEGEVGRVCRSIAEMREVLASVQAVALAGGRSDARERLRDLDRFASTWASTFDAYPDARLDGELGRAVARSEDEAWWTIRTG
ncbi:MAG: hypothetical protein KF901_32130 [Myxococcales bacterium]|nr:hypothetical protein [Myxococcales bacterium]